jgi:fructose-bisphosphate aldolase class I
MLLKPSMVVPGKDHDRQATPAEVAADTIRVLRRAVPAAVPSINFLSGGQTPVEATANLDAINRTGVQPWLLSFSYGRALQEPSLQAWNGPGRECTSKPGGLAATRPPERRGMRGQVQRDDGGRRVGLVVKGDRNADR